MTDIEADTRGIEGFRLLRLLGSGRRGSVYLAEQSQPRRPVAVRLLSLHDLVGGGAPGGGPERGPDSLQADAAARATFERAAAALGSLHHPGIAGLIASGWTADGRAFLVHEYIDGTDLLRYAEQHALCRRQRIELVARVCDAVDHAHRRGVVHGALRPAALRMDATGAPRLLDFAAGSAQLAKPSPAGAADASRDSASEAGDVQALGRLLTELLAPAPAAAAALRGDLRDIVAAASGESSVVPRYASAAALADDLRRSLAQLPLAARPAGLLRRGLLFTRRHVAPVGVGALLLASIVTALLLTVRSTREARTTTGTLRRLQMEVSGLSDYRVLEELLRRADDRLWPASPELASAMEAWLAEAQLLRGRLEPLRALLAGPDFRADGADADARLLREEFEELHARLESFFDPVKGRVAAVEARRERALALQERTIGRYALQWQQCIEEVARSPRYGGLRLAPQCGLIPLGEDRRSRCAEFAVEGTGELPLRDPSTGSLCRPRAEDALVLVLIPGGEHRLHADWEAPAMPEGGWPEGRAPERPAARVVQLPPQFIGKYEVTQAQGLRLLGSRPSTFGLGWTAPGQPTVTDLNPLESVKSRALLSALLRYGLRLPTPDAWEAAARGGEGLCGAELGVAALECLGNVSDFHALRHGGSPRSWREQLLLDDGYELHAPIGSFLPNGYGLYDTLGNVTELALEPRAGKPCVVRGGGFTTPPHNVHPACSRNDPDGGGAPEVGVRVARLLDDVVIPLRERRDTAGVSTPVTSSGEAGR